MPYANDDDDDDNDGNDDDERINTQTPEENIVDG